jgi:acetyl-CoA carboxylase biotin carboxyl carrier protein
MAKKKRAAAKSGNASASGPSPEMAQLEEIFRLMTSYGIAEVELENAEGRLHAKMPSAQTVTYAAAPSVAPAPVSAPSMSSAAPAASSPAPAAAKAALAPNQKKILSPFVGTFYRASNPNAAPYAKEGQPVKKGQTLCIIEAMKLMNEIESEFDGKIVSILVENGQPVEFGEPLFVIET